MKGLQGGINMIVRGYYEINLINDEDEIDMSNETDIIERAKTLFDYDIQDRCVHSENMHWKVAKEKDNREITLNLLDEFDVYELHLILYNKKKEITDDTYRRMDLIRLLEGNEKNEEAKNRLRHENDMITHNNDKIKIIDNLLEQLLPLVDRQIGL